VTRTLLLLGLVLSASCSFTQRQNAPKEPLSSIQIGPEDWLVETKEGAPVSALIKTVKKDRLDFLRRNIRLPTLSPLHTDSGSGFEIYQITGYPELEASAYIHPKIYLQSAMAQGSILGYRTEVNGVSNDLVEISIPVALVDGLVEALPLPGGARSGTNSAVSLPAGYKIEDPKALEASVNRPLKVLPVCPRVFRLAFEGREYLANSPFERLSACPINQFFRVTFKATAKEMRRLLDTAATKEDAVSLVADLEATFDYPTRRVDLTIDPAAFYASLAEKLSAFKESGLTQRKHKAYSAASIESAVESSLIELGSAQGFSPQLGRGFASSASNLILDFFDAPMECPGEGMCRALNQKRPVSTPIRLGWLETESLGTAIQTRSISSLGSVANSSRFIAKPARDQLSEVRRPASLSGYSFGELVQYCVELNAGNPVHQANLSASERTEVEAYCRSIAENSARNDSDLEQADGYYPLGNNTVVYPGAWLRLDVEEISEFTTAKTRTNRDGSVSIQSEVIDLLAGQPAESRTSCTNGATLACAEYKKRSVPILSRDGSQARDAITCKKEEEGVNGCQCTKPESGAETCTRPGNYQFQEVLDSTCDPKDEITYCPFWRAEEHVVAHEIEYECHDVKVKSKTTFLCLDGCDETHEVQCKEKSRKPVKAMRQVLNCIEDEAERIAELTANRAESIPERRATAHRVKECKRPQYQCAKWNQACTKYAVNEAFHIVHEEPTAKWRPFALEQGEFPPRFEEDIYLKFVSRAGKTATNCRLSDFPRELRGSTVFIKIPTQDNESQPCDRPIWDKETLESMNLPKVYLKNAISYTERRLCGKTEYSFVTKELPLLGDAALIPSSFALKTEVNVGPIKEACLSKKSFQVGSDLWFTERPPIRFTGRVSVLGRMLESILTEVKP
jgi:hypothetical protein